VVLFFSSNVTDENILELYQGSGRIKRFPLERKDLFDMEFDE
jgi:hypothetical protein